MSHCYPTPPAGFSMGLVKAKQQLRQQLHADSSTTPTSVLTLISDRLYLAAYAQPPNAQTVFPYPETPVSPRKRAQAAAQAPAPSRRATPCYFTVDDILLYNAFHHDFGPLHIGHLYRFAIQFHDILGAKENKDRPIVFWSGADPRSKFFSSLAPCHP
jgi:cell division cycle 14